MALQDDLYLISDIASDSLGGALLLLVIGGAATLLSKAVTAVVVALRARRVHVEKCRQVLVDLVIHTRFLQENVQVRVSEKNIAATKDVIDQSPEDYRAYVLAAPENLLFAEWRTYRHSFKTRRFGMTNADIGLIDAYIAQVRLYLVYYEGLGSDQFANLPRARKKTVLDILQGIGRDALDFRAKVLQIPCLDRIDSEVPRLFKMRGK